VAETRDQIARKFDEAFPEIRKRMTEAYVKKMLPPFLRACALAAIPITGAILVARKFVFLQGVRDPPAPQVNVPSGWLRAGGDYGPGLPPVVPGPTFTREEMKACALGSFVVVCGKYTAYGVIVSHNTVLYPAHLCPIGEPGIIRRAGVAIPFTPGALNSVCPGNSELLLVRIPGLPAAPGIS
jgi:hypothetical protein